MEISQWNISITQILAFFIGYRYYRIILCRTTKTILHNNIYIGKNLINISMKNCFNIQVFIFSPILMQYWKGIFNPSKLIILKYCWQFIINIFELKSTL